MKTLYFLLAMMTTLVSTSQMVDIAFYYHKDSNSGGFDYGVSKPTLPLSENLETKLNESENMSIHEFKKFGLYEGLLEKLKDEMLVVHSYKLVKESTRFDPEVHQSYNGEIDDKSIELVQDAKAGDQYILYDIQVKDSTGIIFRIPLIAKAKIKALP